MRKPGLQSKGNVSNQVGGVAQGRLERPSGKGTFDPRKLGADCKHCPFAVNGKPDRPVRGEGPTDPYGILVGEGPGQEEQTQGRPFVGSTGQLLDERLLSHRLARSRLFVVNATCCRPPIGKSEPMMSKAVRCCRPALLNELRKFNPATPVLAMGKWAYIALTERTKGVMSRRGFTDLKWLIGSSQSKEE